MTKAEYAWLKVLARYCNCSMSEVMMDMFIDSIRVTSIAHGAIYEELRDQVEKEMEAEDSVFEYFPPRKNSLSQPEQVL